MKNVILRVFLLLLAFASVPSWAGDLQFLPDLSGGGPVATRSNLFSDFRSRLNAAIENRDFVAIQGLYQTNGVAAEELKIELARWQKMLREDAKTGVSLFFKELSTLPPKARERWTLQAHQLTEREVTHLVAVFCPPENVCKLLLPLVVVEDRLLIVPSDKRNTELGIEPGGPANGSQPIRSETNQTSSAAGSRR